ncbi:MAG TPA: IclR family transcriptional regulator [Dehalococcoidia bacterium]|nr:IclR family transcriptional regulator [Dehalococcoidia bacterium]
MTATPERNVRSSGVQSINRAVRILTTLAEHPYPMGVKELADQLGISSTAVHRMLGTLAAVGWVEQNARTSRYRVGTRLLGVGAAALITNPIIQNGVAFLQRISEVTGYDSFLSTLVGGRVVYLGRVHGRAGPEIDFAAGVTMPAHAFADGKLLLAYLPEPERKLIYGEGLQRYTERTIVDTGEMEAELATIRKLGYALDRGERFNKGRAMAVAVNGPDGNPLLAMMCVGKMEFSEDFVESLSQQMIEIASDMSEQLTVLGDMPKIAVDFARYNLE